MSEQQHDLGTPFGRGKATAGCEDLPRCDEDMHYWLSHPSHDAGPPVGAPCKCGAKAWAFSPRQQMVAAITGELEHAYEKHGRDPWGRHEFFAILKEEVDELWDDVKSDASTENVLKELVQVAAMCFRYAETGDRYRGDHPLIPSRHQAVPDEGEDSQ